MSLPIPGNLLVIGIIVIVIIALVAWIMSNYKVVPPYKALIINGPKGRRVVTNGATMVIPFFEQVEELSREVRTVEVSRDKVKTLKGIDMLVDWTAQLQISSQEALILNAAAVFLGNNSDNNVMSQVESTLVGNFRSVVSQLTVEQIFTDREEFARKVRAEVADEMQRLGLEIVSLVINEISDPDGQTYLSDLAAPQIAEVQANARIAQAEADRRQREEVAKSQLAATEAEVAAMTKKAQAENAARLTAADLEKEAGIREAEATMARQTKQAELEAELVNTQAKTELNREETRQKVQEKAAIRRRAELEVEEIEPARAAAQGQEIRAQAAAKQAQITAQGELEAAELRAKGTLAVEQAKAEGRKAQLLAEAAGAQAQGEAEAAVERAQGLAKAEAQLKLAEALNAMDDATRRQTLLQLYIENMPEVAQAVASQFAKIGEVKIIDMGSGHGDSPVSRIATTVPTAMLQLDTLLKSMTGLDITSFLAQQMGQHGIEVPSLTGTNATQNNNGVDAPEADA